MSVFIKDYCKGNDNDFAKRLTQLCDDVVFIGSDELDLSDDGFQVVAEIYLEHAISSMDVLFLQRVFSDCYWRFLPSFRGAGFELRINLKREFL